MVRRTIYSGVLIVCCGLFPVSEGLAQLHCSPDWTPEYKCLEHCGPCPTPPGKTRQQQQDQQDQLELQQQLDLRHQREQEEAERKAKADEADAQGLAASKRGDWKQAVNWYIEALELAPDSPEIRAHLDQANAELRDTATAADILALRQRIEDAIAAARIAGLQQRLEDDVSAQRLTAMLGHLRSNTNARIGPSAGSGGGRTEVLYPALLRSVSPGSPPAMILAQNEPKIKEVDEEIHRAQETLRHLIASNTQSEKDRVEWTRESEEATIDAQDLSVSLVIDLIGAHVDHLTETSDKERADVLNHLLNRTKEDGQRNGIHVAYRMLLERKNELDRLHREVRLATKENDLRILIRDFSVNKDTKFTKENLWDVICLKLLEDLAGPSKDLLDAAYTIYRQASSLDHLAVIQANQEKTLQAAASLHRYIVRLEAKKVSAR